MGTLLQIAPLVRRLRDRLHLDTLVETGFDRGESCLWAAGEFDCVVSIDKYVAPKSPLPPNVSFVLGDTRCNLGNYTKRRSIFWLDAHTHDDCPVLDELDLILKESVGSIILVDDARWVHWMLHWRDKRDAIWPSIPSIEARAKRAGYDMFVTVHDVILLLPEDDSAELTM